MGHQRSWCSMQGSPKPLMSYRMGYLWSTMKQCVPVSVVTQIRSRYIQMHTAALEWGRGAGEGRCSESFFFKKGLFYSVYKTVCRDTFSKPSQTLTQRITSPPVGSRYVSHGPIWCKEKYFRKRKGRCFPLKSQTYSLSGNPDGFSQSQFP